ncbi:MAG: alpha/beta hydrolase [Eubacteriaceae bacterium]|nr:alpha/beta hydrolase [Eubacteriaceae bacterium]
MDGWASSSCEANGARLHYARTGGGKPPVVLLHGLMASGACWTGLARVLESEYDVIMPDARGHGSSSVPVAGYRYEDHANDIAGLIEALGLDAPILVGHSMGGMAAAVAASRKPDFARGVVLADPTFLSLGIQREVRDSDVADKHRQMLKMPLSEVVADALKRHPNRPMETIELMSRAWLQTSMAAFDVLTPPNPDYETLMGNNIDVPSLIVVGDSGVVSPAIVRKLQNINPKLQAEIIPAAGHSVHLDQPVRFAAAIKAFLRPICYS